MVCDFTELYRYLIDDFLIEYCRDLSSRDFKVKTENLGRKRIPKQSKEVAVIPLYEKLLDFFVEKKLLTTRTMEIPTEPPEEITIGQFAKPFSAILDIEVVSKIQDQTKTTRKKFRLGYIFNPIPKYEYEADYEVLVNEHMGEWVNYTK